MRARIGRASRVRPSPFLLVAARARDCQVARIVRTRQGAREIVRGTPPEQEVLSYVRHAAGRYGELAYLAELLDGLEGRSREVRLTF